MWPILFLKKVCKLILEFQKIKIKRPSDFEVNLFTMHSVEYGFDTMYLFGIEITFIKLSKTGTPEEFSYVIYLLSKSDDLLTLYLNILVASMSYKSCQGRRKHF